MKLRNKLVLDNLKRSICIASAGTIIIGIGAINLNEKIHRSKLNNDEKVAIVETKATNENIEDINGVSFDPIKDEKDYYNYTEYTIGTEELIYDDLEDISKYQNRYENNKEFDVSKIFIVTLSDSTGKNYFIMERDGSTNVNIGDGMLDYYSKKFRGFKDYHVNKWGTVYNSIFNPQYRLVEHGYDIEGTGKNGSKIEGKYSRSELWTPSDDHIFIAHLKEDINVYDQGSNINIVHRNYIYKFMPPLDKDNLFKGTINTVNLSSLYSSMTITYKELCNLYNDLVKNNNLEDNKTL